MRAHTKLGQLTALTRIDMLSVRRSLQAVVFVSASDGGLWGPKAASALASDGSFTVAGWATDPNDATTPGVTVVIVPVAYNSPLVLGLAALPAAVTAQCVVSASATRAASAATGGSTSSTALTFVVSLPAIGSTGAINGVALNTPQEYSAYKVALFVITSASAFYGPKATAVLNTDGTFQATGMTQRLGSSGHGLSPRDRRGAIACPPPEGRGATIGVCNAAYGAGSVRARRLLAVRRFAFRATLHIVRLVEAITCLPHAGWAQSADDATAPSIGAYLLPQAMVIPTVSGDTSLPPTIMSAEVAYVNQRRDITQPTLPAGQAWVNTTAASSGSSSTSTAVGSDGMAWPPGDTGTAVNAGTGAFPPAMRCMRP
jgi:hypothetical protein